MTGHTQITENEAKEKRCKNNQLMNCIGKECMSWPDCKKTWEDL